MAANPLAWTLPVYSSEEDEELEASYQAWVSDGRPGDKHPRELLSWLKERRDQAPPR